MTINDWLKHIEEAYKFPFREDIRVENWKKKEFTEDEKEFLFTQYSKEYTNLHKEHILEIIEMFTRYFFKIAFEGYTFCSLDKVNSKFGISLEKKYGVSSGPFYNLAKTYWTFRIQLDEDQYKHRESMPLFFPLLRTVETNIAGEFFPTAGFVDKSQQRKILKEFAPNINIDSFIAENPMFKSKKGGCLGTLLIIIIVIFIIIWIIS